MSNKKSTYTSRSINAARAIRLEVACPICGFKDWPGNYQSGERGFREVLSNLDAHLMAEHDIDVLLSPAKPAEGLDSFGSVLDLLQDWHDAGTLEQHVTLLYMQKGL